MILLKQNPLKSRILVRRLAMGSFCQLLLWFQDYALSSYALTRDLLSVASRRCRRVRVVGRGDDTVGNPHWAQFSQFELFELILLSKLDKQFPVEQFEASRAIRGSSISVSSTLPPLLCGARPKTPAYIYIYSHVYIILYTHTYTHIISYTISYHVIQYDVLYTCI